MGLFDGGYKKKILKLMYAVDKLKIGMTELDAYRIMSNDIFEYQTSELENNTTKHFWKYPKSVLDSKEWEENHYAAVAIFAQNKTVKKIVKYKYKNQGLITDSIIEDENKFKETVKKGTSPNFLHAPINDEGFVDLTSIKITCKTTRKDFNCDERTYKSYVFDTIQYCNINKPYAFISYSSKDYMKVWSDVIALQTKGYNLWIDKNMKETDATWSFSAMNALSNENCKLVIFYMSKSSLLSNPCYCELEYREQRTARNNHNGETIPYIIVEAEKINDFNDFTASINNESGNLDNMLDNYINSSKKRIKYTNESNKDEYFKKIEKILEDNNISCLSYNELYGKAVELFGDTYTRYSAISILEYCYRNGYMPAILLRAFIQEKPIYKDFFTNDETRTLEFANQFLDADKWLEWAQKFKQRRYVVQAASFYSAYALVKNNREAYKEAAKLWKLVPQKEPLFYSSCMFDSNMLAIDLKGDMELKMGASFNDLFNLTPLTSFNSTYYTVGTANGTTTAYDISPDAINSGSGKITPNYSLSEEDKKLAQLIQNYGFNYIGRDLYDTEAGYYAVQLAVWGRLKNYDPANLMILSTLSDTNKEIALKVKNLASALYNDYSGISYGLNFTYNRETPNESYTLNSDKYSLYYIDGEWYYRSEQMAVTTYGLAGKLSYTVTLDGDGFITTSSQNTDNKSKTLTLGGDYGNIFYVFIPADKKAGETTVNVFANYIYSGIMTWDYASGSYGSGQRIMSNYLANRTQNFSVKLIKEPIEEQQEETTYKAKINFTKTGIGIIDYSTLSVNGETFYSLTKGLTNIDTYLAFYTVEEDNSDKLMGKGAYRTSNGKLTASNLPLSYIDENHKGRVLVCEIDSPEGYGQFKDDDNPFKKNGHMYSCFKYAFDTTNADTNNVITRDITEEDSAKSFSVNITKKDQNGTLLSGYNFGLYTTKEIKVSGKETIPADSLVAYATTNESGVATIDTYLPASQNYVLKEIGFDNKEYDIIVNEDTLHASKIELDVLNKATVDGYEFNVVFQER